MSLEYKKSPMGIQWNKRSYIWEDDDVGSAFGSSNKSFGVWERTRRKLCNTLPFGGWNILLADLEVESIVRHPNGGDHFRFTHPDPLLAPGLIRIERQICMALQSETGHPTTMEIVIAPAAAEGSGTGKQERPHEDRVAEEDNGDCFPEEEEEALLQRMRIAAHSGHQEKLARYGVRNKQFRYYPIGTYEALFWRAYLGSGPYALWDALRAHAEAGLPWPSQRDLAEIAVGSRNSTRTAAEYLAILRNEGLIFWRDINGETEYYIRKELTLLTPHQAQKLSAPLQKEHKNWLRRVKLIRQWSRSEAKTFIPPISIDDEKVIAFQRIA